jgi:hypothetical protein
MYEGDSEDSQGSNHSMTAKDIIETRESMEPLTVDLLTQFIQTVLANYHEGAPSSTWELAIS